VGAGTHSKIVILILIANTGLIAAAALSLSKEMLGVSGAVLIVGLLFERMQVLSKAKH